MTDWMYVQENPAEQLAQIHFFSVIKRQPGGDVPFRITIKEFASPPPGQRLRFFVEADKPIEGMLIAESWCSHCSNQGSWHRDT